MKALAAWRAASASDTGLQRTENEDRVFVDEELGIFLVVDGLGGHAAGEHAAGIAVREIATHLRTCERNDIETEVRTAITAANNRIYEAAQSNAAWQGMACVLTLAMIHDDYVTVGHVGDSRLYVFRNGRLRKLTADHSPVGEQEDHGELTERDAMRHPRRNEVFRDVGSAPRESNDEHFIDTQKFALPADGALLLCSDGLSDVLTSAQIAGILDHFEGDPQRTTQELVEAANLAGGIDNVSVILIAGSDFVGSGASALATGRARHAITRERAGAWSWPDWLKSAALLLAGVVLGASAFLLAEWWVQSRSVPPMAVTAAQHSPEHIAVNGADSLGIIKALSAAGPGDTIDVPKGQYLGPLNLKEHVNIEAEEPGQAVVQSDPKSAAYPGIAIAANGIRDARVRGLAISGDEAHPLRVGMLIENSSIEADEIDISGAIEAGVLIDGASSPLLLANVIHGNLGPAVVIRGQSRPRLSGNTITANSLSPESGRSGIEISGDAQPVLANNVVSQNGSDLKDAHGPKPKTKGKPGDLAAPRQ
ncbi:MAG: protein phosphatase 2C domain-containing protein [Acidobacteriaceae bacterium]|nr:protein phosphatase 2C domain-containing protein [Acidobacteriaceae bacterium]